VDKVHSAQATGKSRDYFEQGTLFIDFVDPRDNKLLKRSRVERPVLRNVTPEVRSEKIREAVDEALRDVRLAP
jgi:hypothetical protein